MIKKQIALDIFLFFFLNKNRSISLDKIIPVRSPHFCSVLSSLVKSLQYIGKYWYFKETLNDPSNVDVE